jgi:hypothetical protein
VRRRSACLLAAGSLIITAGVSILPASAASGTFTKITSPKGPGQHIYQFFNLLNQPDHLQISGVVSDDVRTGGTGLDVYCFSVGDTVVESTTPLNGTGTPIPVASDNTFAASIQAPNNTTCTLRAVPSGSITFSGSNTSDYVGSYGGPVFYVGGYEAVPNTAGRTVTTAVIAVQPRSVLAFGSSDQVGILEAYPGDDFSQIFHREFGVMLATTGANIVPPAGTPVRSEIVVDGHHAYLPTTLDSFVSDHTTVPSATVTRSRSSSTGELKWSESAPLKWCSGNGYPQDDPTDTCTAISTGVTLVRTAASSSGGALGVSRDAFVSTDGLRHTVNVEFSTQVQHEPNGTVGFKQPGQSSFSSRAPNTTVTSLPVGAHTVFATNDIYSTDNTPSHVVWGLTYSRKPQLYYAGLQDPSQPTYAVAYRYTLTVPAGGSVKLGFGASVSFSSSAVKTLATSAEKALTPHLALTAPALTTSDNTPTIKGRVTNATNGFPAKVTITIGTTSKTVSVNQSTGTFSVTWVHLANGKHTAKAKAIDPSGLVLTAARTFKVT